MPGKNIQKFVSDNFVQKGKTEAIPVSGKIFGKEEIANLIPAVAAALKKHLSGVKL